MKVTLWGSRGSLPSPGPDTIRYGGNTTCVSAQGSRGSLLVLDAGTGIRCLGQNLPQDLARVDILLTHLHMDHIQGLPFFAPLRRRGTEVHIVGPASTTLSLRTRLMRYLSPPLFPVNLRELDANLHFHEVPSGPLEIGEFSVSAQLVIHYNPTVGYRIQESGATVTFLPDHEPALGSRKFPDSEGWTSGYDLAQGADLLIHDAQYTEEEYRDRIGFGHSTLEHAFAFAELASVKHLVTFHHDPNHSDDMLDHMTEQKIAELQPAFTVTPGREEMVFDVAKSSNAGL